MSINKGWLRMCACTVLLLCMSARGFSTEVDEYASVVLSEDERAWLQKKHTVRVRVGDAPPWEINTPNPQGMSVDYLTIIGEQFGIDFQFFPGNEAWVDGFNDMAGDHLHYDLLPAAKRTEKRLAYFAMSDDYLHSPWVVFSRQETSDILSLEDLRGKKVAVERGYVMHNLLQTTEPEIDLAPQENTVEALLALSTGKVEAYVGNIIVSDYLLRRHGITNLKIAGSTPFGDHSQAMVTRQEWAPLISIINKGLNAMSAEQNIAIQQKWIPPATAAKSQTIALTPEERAWLGTHPVIRARVGNVPPYHFWDNGPQGISVDLLNHIADKIGFRVEYLKGMSWLDAVASIRSHENVDLLLTAKRTPERETYMIFSRDYLKLPWVIFTRQNENAIFALENLFGKTVAIEEGYVMQERLAKEFPQIRQRLFKDAAEALAAVSENQADAYVGNLTIAQYHIAHLGFTNLKVAATTGLGDHTQAFAMRDDWPQFAAILDKGLAATTPEERSVINRKYFTVEVAQKVDYTRLWWALLTIGLVVGFIVLWNYFLRNLQKRLEAQNAQLKQEIAERKRVEEALQQRTHALNERVKELNCLYGIAHLVEKPDISLEEIIQGTVELIPVSWRYPEITCARIMLNDQQFKTDNFVESDWKLTSEIIVIGEPAGNLEVCYLAEKPAGDAGDEGPFLKEERKLIDAITERLGRIIGRWQIEEALRENRAKYHTLFNKMLDGFALHEIICDDNDNPVDYRFLDVNPAFETLTGLTREFILNKTVLEALPDTESYWIERYGHVAITGKPVFFENFSRELSKYFYVTAFSPQKGQFACIFEDITERKQTDKALRKSEKNLNKAQAIAHLGYWELDTANMKVTGSDELFSIFGLIRDEATLESFVEVIHPDDREYDVSHIQRGLELGESWDIEHRLILRDGTQKWVHAIGEAIKDESGKTVSLSGITQDITERKRAEEELEKAKQAAEAANQAKSAFLANMSHELRTPLNAILGFAQLLGHATNLNSEQQDHLSTIHRSGDHLLALINQVLDLSKIEAGRAELNVSNFDLWDLSDEMEEMFRLRAKNKRLELLFERASDIPRYIRTDKVKLRQILINILNNALKFTKTGGITVRVDAAEIGFFQKTRFPQPQEVAPTYLRFEISDSGPGIAPDELSKLFEAFVQTRTGRESHKGTGLGLAISKRFVKLMGGEIKAESEVGQGTTFTVEIPAGTADASAIETGKPDWKIIALEPNQPRYRMLIADDIEDNRRLLINLLNQFDFELREAADGQEAVEIWKEWRPHLIWMDIRMPIMDGMEATKRIRNSELRMGNRESATTDSIPDSEFQSRNSKIIAVTAGVFEEDRGVAMASGCDDFISKPFNTSDVFNLMTKHLGVRFVYEQSIETDSVRDAGADKNVLTSARLNALPEEQLVALKVAAIRTDPKDSNAAIDRIREHDKPLADALVKLVKTFRFDIIQELLEDA
ncbi:transporter substrate-binding domain-containing protein [Desulfococcaceae bacterium HSG7]|nr:transporter substrate-binding domain-containing protein [Desulfococcaceae bacterium HSG7]